MNQILENIKTRRSVRGYKDTPVKKEDLEKITEAGLYAPSARNSQNWQLTVVQGKDKLEKLSFAMADALGKDYHNFYGAPVLIIVSAPKDYRHAIADCSTVMENMFLAANSLALGSVWINQLLDVADAPDVRALLTQFGVPEDHMVPGSAAMGYASVEVDKDRKNLGKVVYA